MKKFNKTLASIVLCVSFTMQAHAGIIFSFTESNGDVIMNASGTLNTANLVSVNVSSWGGVGIETNGVPESDIMGDTSSGAVDTAFGFNTGTDLSSWVGDMFTASNFSWVPTSTTSFTTYYRLNGVRTPGIGIATQDLNNGLWTPDNFWLASGATFTSLGLTEGDYTITDALTGESISIQIGDVVEASSPATLALLGISLIGLGFTRRK